MRCVGDSLVSRLISYYRQNVSMVEGKYYNFYLRDVVSGVLSTITNVSGWVAGCQSQAGIVSKRLNLSENFFRPSESPIILVS